MRQQSIQPGMKEEAIKWHLENVKIYKGTKCEAHNKSIHICKVCEDFKYITEKLTYEEAKAAVEYRIKNKLSLTGFNARPQEEWTY